MQRAPEASLGSAPWETTHLAPGTGPQGGPLRGACRPRRPPTSGFQDLQVSGVLGRGRGAGGHGQGHVSVQQLLKLLQEDLAL